MADDDSAKTYILIGVSWQGHFGGAIAGALLALLLFATERRENRS